MPRNAIFAAVRAARGNAAFSDMEVAVLDDCLDRLRVPRGAAAAPPAAGGHRRVGARGLALIKSFEGFRAGAYFCPARVLTIGYGSTGPHVTKGMQISESEGEALLQRDLARFEKCVEAAVPGASQNRFDAMVSLAFNIGEKAFTGSTVARKAKGGDHAGAKAAFSMWNKGGGKVLPGLTRRRAAEAALYGEG